MKNEAAGGHWAIQMQESLALIGLIIGVAHPQLYQQGIMALT